MFEKSTLNAANKAFLLALAVFHSTVTSHFHLPNPTVLLCHYVFVLLCCVTCACSCN